MTIGLCIAGYLLTAWIFLFVFAYSDKANYPDVQVGNRNCGILAMLWPVVLLILLGWFVIDIPLGLADRYARKHNSKKEEAKS